MEEGEDDFSPRSRRINKEVGQSKRKKEGTSEKRNKSQQGDPTAQKPEGNRGNWPSSRICHQRFTRGDGLVREKSEGIR